MAYKSNKKEKNFKSVDENYWQRRWEEEKVFVSKINEQKQNLFSGSVQKLKDKVKYKKFLKNGWNTKINKIKGIGL